MPSSDPDLAGVVDAAVADLSSRLVVAPESIEVVRADRVTWPDGSLGCPQPGQAYTQALIDGFRVILGHEGRVFDYHAGSDAEPSLCPSEDKDGGYGFVPPPGFDR